MARAKEGDEITATAREKLATAMGGRMTAERLPTHVGAKAEGERGQWFCATCGELPQNNMQADTHERSHPKHKLAWRSFDSGKIEAP